MAGAALLAVAATGSVPTAGAAGARPPLAEKDGCERHMIRAAAQHGIPVGVLYAVGLTETRRRNSLHPYAMNIAGKPVFPATRDDALRQFAQARNSGARLIDIGCMQINHFYHSARFASVAEMFDPQHNVAYAAAFLKSLKSREKTWTMAVARYHAGPGNHAAQKVYICRVAANLNASGFGRWTGNARSFCSGDSKVAPGSP
jgi:soluble lytic murein transglycosylase-like protein